MPPTLRRRQRSNIASSYQSQRITKTRSRNMVSTRSSTRKSGQAMARASSSSSPVTTTSQSTTASQTFPELVRSRIAYSPAPSIASSSTSSTFTAIPTLTPHDFLHPNRPRQHLLWPSQLCASTATAAPLTSQRAASSASSAGSPEPSTDAKAGERLMRDRGLDEYRAALQSALRKARR